MTWSRVTGAPNSFASDHGLARQIVAMIDASLIHALKADSATLASWRQARRTTVKGTVSRDVGEVTALANGGAPLTNGGAPVVNGGVPAVAPSVSVSNTAVPAAGIKESSTVGTVIPAIRPEFEAAQLGIGQLSSWFRQRNRSELVRDELARFIYRRVIRV